MAREYVQDIDEVSRKARKKGLLTLHFGSSVAPLGKVDHRMREAFGVE